MRETELTPSLERHGLAGALRLLLVGSLIGLILAIVHGGRALADQGYLELGFTHMAAALLRDHFLWGQLMGVGFALAPVCVYLGAGPRNHFRPRPWFLGGGGAAVVCLYMFSRFEYLEYLLFLRWYRPVIAVLLGFLMLEGLRRSGVIASLADRFDGPLRFPKLKASLLASCIFLPTLTTAVVARAAEPYSAGRPNVLLIFVDTMRPDHLSAYGYQRPTTPALERFAAESVRFEYATTPRDKTTPAMASAFTGQYPHTHGIRDLLLPLPPRPVTLAEQFRSLGYQTFAVIGNFVLTRELSKLDQGFDVYEEELRDLESNRHTYERRAGSLTDGAIAQLEKADDRPFFAYLHYMDPHGPYDPPEPYRSMFKSPPGRELPIVPIKMDEVVRDSIPRHQAIDGQRDVNFYIDRYDGEIRYWDSQFERLMTWLKERGRLDDTWIIVTADHGEAMGEHGIWFEHGHASLNGAIRVPLIIRPPGGIKGRVVSEPTQLVDLYPTLTDILGVEPLSPVEGVSLKPWLEGKEGKTGTVTFAAWKGFSQSVQNGKWRLQWRYDKKGSVVERRLYAIDRDPMESENVYTHHPEVVAALEPLLMQWIEAGRLNRLFKGGAADVPEPTRPPVDLATQEKLRSLGYIQ